MQMENVFINEFLFVKNKEFTKQGLHVPVFCLRLFKKTPFQRINSVQILLPYQLII